MSITLENTMGLRGGQYLATGTVTLAESDGIKSIVVHEDAVFTAITDQGDNDVFVEWNFGAATIKSGFVFGAKSGKTIKTVTLASGSVLLLR